MKKYSVRVVCWHAKVEREWVTGCSLSQFPLQLQAVHTCCFQVFVILQYNRWLFEMCPVLNGCDFFCSTTVYRWCMVVSPTSKYDEPEVEMSHEGAARVRHFQPRVIIFEVACTTVLHLFCRMINHWLKIWLLKLIFNFYQQFGQQSCICSTPFRRWHRNIPLTMTHSAFGNDECHMTSFRPISKAAHSWSYDSDLLSWLLEAQSWSWWSCGPGSLSWISQSW